MLFKDRTEAGKLLAKKLSMYKNANTVVYAIPRGGVVPAVEIARRLFAPLDLIITRKISHPYNPEYAVAAIAENGHIVGSKNELEDIDPYWLKQAIERQRKEVKKRKNIYGLGQTPDSLTNKTVILVDDGIATGLTMKIAIKEIQHKNPKKVVVAVPVISQSTFRTLQQEVDEVVAQHIPDDEVFRGAVGAYYEKFPQISDEEIISILRHYDKEYTSLRSPGLLNAT